MDDIIKDVKQTTAAVAIAATLAAGGAVASEADVDSIASLASIQAPTPIVLDLSETVDADADDEDDKNRGNESATEVTAGKSRAETIATALITPLYVAAMLLINLIVGAVKLASIPVLGAVVKWAFMALAVLGVLAIVFKTAFPDVPLRKVLNRKCVIFIFVATAGGSVLCEVLRIFAPKIGMWIEAIRIIIGLAVTISIFLAFAKALRDRRRKANQEEAKTA